LLKTQLALNWFDLPIASEPNIAEGEGRGRFLDNRRFVRMSRGSLNETKHWLRRAYKRGLLNKRQVEGLKVVIDQLSPMLNAYLKSIGDASITKAAATPKRT
jgi:four helix bundle protein